MNNQRFHQIKGNLQGLGTLQDMPYTNQEIVEGLVSLQQAMAHGVFVQTHAENLHDRGITRHFQALAKESGLHDRNADPCVGSICKRRGGTDDKK